MSARGARHLVVRPHAKVGDVPGIGSETVEQGLARSDIAHVVKADAILRFLSASESRLSDPGVILVGLRVDAEPLIQGV